MKVLIIEDEPATAQRLEKMLLELDSNIFIQDTIDTVEDSIDYFKMEYIQILCLWIFILLMATVLKFSNR
jgi:hypothetical protein